MKEAYDFGGHLQSPLGTWPDEVLLPGFRDATVDFYKVRLPASDD
jgi:hypothetical protein